MKFLFLLSCFFLVLNCTTQLNAQCEPPVILKQPESKTVCAGSTVFFQVVSSGSDSTYQWQKNGINIPGVGATSSVYIINSPTPADSGTYTVFISNACGSITSDPATLTVDSPPAITIQPQDQTVCEGATATFSVTATGGSLSFQWNKNGIAIAGATSSTYTTPPVTSADNGAIFNVVVTNSCGSITSSDASLIVGSSFTFTTTNLSPTTENGADGSIIFTITSGTGSFLYSINNGVSFETSNTFLGLSAGVYNLVVKDGCGMQTCQVILFSPQIAAGRVNTPLFGSSLGSNIISFTQPSHGTVTINPDGTYVYQPNECFSGNDSFTYNVTSPCGQTTNTVLIVISFWTSCIEDPTDPIYNPFPTKKLPEDYYPCVLFNRFENGDFVYRMWHQGPTGIAMSASQDGIHWKFVGNTNLEGTHSCVIFNEKGFRNHSSKYRYIIWFWTGKISTDVGAIQYSFSNDGIHWLNPQPITQNPSKPLVFGAQGTPFYQVFGPGFVLFNPHAQSIKGMPYTFPFVMFYDISNGSPTPGAHAVGLAYSKNGINWNRYGSNPILSPGNSTDWDGTNVFRPSMIKVEGTYHLFYSGSNATIDPATTVSYAHGIGHASSNDGVNWIKDSDNPIFIFSDGVEWRNSRTYTPFVLYDDFKNVRQRNSTSSSQNPNCLANFLKMWFGGGMGTTIGKNQGIGYATWPCCENPKIIFPPSDFIGIIKKNEFVTQTEFILIAKWKASPSPEVKSYHIFQNGKIVATIAANKPLKFKTRLSLKNSNFEIAAVSENNIESLHVALRIVNE